MLEELQSLAALASSQTDVIVKRGERGCNWSFNWKSRVITANPEDLDVRPPDYCRGLILHEAAHAAITRLGSVVPEARRSPALHLLLNVVEDCRIENWLQQRFPGSAEWIRLYNNHLFGIAGDRTARMMREDPAAAYLFGILDRWWNPQPIYTPHPEAAAALDAVWPHFLEAAAAYPPARAGVPLNVLRAYPAHPVSLCYQAADKHQPPSPEECEIRMTQHRMWSITWSHIVPPFIALLRHPDSKRTRGMIRTLAKAADGGGDLFAEGAAHPGAGREAGSKEAPFAQGNADDYQSAVSRHADLIRTCGDVLLRHLTMDCRPKRTRHHRSGQHLDLKVAMQFEADPRQYARLWQRTRLPRHPDPAFVVAVDCSGSMSGSKARNAFAAVVVIREICLRLGIPLSVISFNAMPNLLQPDDASDSAAIRARIAGILKPKGGTDLTEALGLASKLLARCTRRHRHLWILSDGITRNPDQVRRQLEVLRQSGTRIHGIGLDAASDHMTQLIPGSPAGVQPHQLPAVFATNLGRMVMDAA